jgi:hypothetical protein
VHDLWLAEQMAASSSLFIGIDESSKVTGRSFVEIEIGGRLRNEDSSSAPWCSPLAVREMVSHTAEKMIEVIEDEFQRINEIQRERGLHESRIYEVKTIIFDLTSSNTGRLGGLGQKLKELRKAVWEHDKAANTIPDWLKGTSGAAPDLPPLLIEKGCEDHLTALISTEFAKR